MMMVIIVSLLQQRAGTIPAPHCLLSLTDLSDSA